MDREANFVVTVHTECGKLVERRTFTDPGEAYDYGAAAEAGGHLAVVVEPEPTLEQELAEAESQLCELRDQLNALDTFNGSDEDYYTLEESIAFMENEIERIHHAMAARSAARESAIELTDPSAEFDGNYDDTTDGTTTMITLNGRHLANVYVHAAIGGDITIELMPGALVFLNPASDDVFFAPSEVLPALRAAFC